MPIVINRCKYYRTAEVCHKVGISRTTLFRWLAEGIFKEPESRDRRGWRLFTEEEVNRMEAEANRISRVSR